MDVTPNYGFNRRPRFSANHLAAYLCTEHASQRDAVIRRAKFPRKIDVAAYQQVVPTIRSFFTSKTRGPVHFASLRDRLEARARRGDAMGEERRLWTS